MHITVDLTQKDDGRWVAKIPGLPGVEVQAATQHEALLRAQHLALRTAVVQKIDELRERLAETHGTMSDSTLLVREDRDR